MAQRAKEGDWKGALQELLWCLQAAQHAVPVLQPCQAQDARPVTVWRCWHLGELLLHLPSRSWEWGRKPAGGGQT